MRNIFTLVSALVFSMLLATTDSGWAVTVTGGTGPGGVGTTDGSSNLTLWLKGDNIINGAEPLPDASVGSWFDSSGSGFTATGAGQPTYKTPVLNSLPAVRFATGGLSVAAFDNSTDKTIFAISASGDVTVWNPFLMHTANAGMSYGWVSSNLDNTQLIEDGVATQAASTTVLVDDQFSVTTGRWNSSGNEIFINGASEATNGDLLLGTAGNSLSIGFRGGTFFDGDIAEVAIFNTALDMVQRKIIENALSAKYDLAMASPLTNDLYSGDTPGNGDYDSEVFGIGQFDSVAFTSSGSAGFGIEAINGAELQDGEFALAGHKVESNTELDRRWDRSWYLDNRLGGEETLTLAFDWSDAGLGTANPDFVELMFSSSDGGPFSSIAVGSLVGDTVTFTGLLASDLANGYYTLGVVHVPEPSSFLLLGLGALGLMRHTRRRRRRA